METDNNEKQREQQFIQGYNEGYLLSRYEPDSLKELMQTPKQDDPRFDGMAAGQKAHARELFLENVQKARALNEQSNRPKLR